MVGTSLKYPFGAHFMALNYKTMLMVWLKRYSTWDILVSNESIDKIDLRINLLQKWGNINIAINADRKIYHITFRELDTVHRKRIAMLLH